MHKADNNPRARVANRMAERDGAAVDVDLARVDCEDLLSRFDDHGKRLVDLEQRNVVLCQPSLFQRKRERNRWCDGKIDRLGGRIRVGWGRRTNGPANASVSHAVR
jgi:hypothetical protein